MKNFILTILVSVCTLFTFTSCVTAQAYDTSYKPYDLENNLAVVDNVCYVYYTNPTTLFLNSLHIIDGAYYYWYTDRYIPVVFPKWEIWSPHRYFYYDRNRWMWRDRYRYNHNEYRRNHHWNDYRRPPHPSHHPRVTPPQRRSDVSHNRPPRVNRDGNMGFGNRTRPNVNSSTRITVNRGGHTPTHRGGRR